MICKSCDYTNTLNLLPVSEGAANNYNSICFQQVANQVTCSYLIVVMNSVFCGELWAFVYVWLETSLRGSKILYKGG